MIHLQIVTFSHASKMGYIQHGLSSLLIFSRYRGKRESKFICDWNFEPIMIFISEIRYNYLQQYIIFT